MASQVVASESGSGDTTSNNDDELETWEIALISGSGSLAVLMLGYAAWLYTRRSSSADDDTKTSTSPPLDAVVVVDDKATSAAAPETAKEQKDRIKQTVSTKAEKSTGRILEEASAEAMDSMSRTAKRSRDAVVKSVNRGIDSATASLSRSLRDATSMLDERPRAREQVSARRQRRI